jgi:23S rRNA pseudouridine955/2504/2580 synthase
VRVDGKRVETSTRLAEGQKVRVPPLKLLPAAPAVKKSSPDDARELARLTLYEDADLLVLNKPFGLAVQGGSGTTRHIDMMLESLAKGGSRPVLVHRLDRDTSGVLLIAKNRRAAADLGEAFRSRQAQKIYWALVEGAPKPAQGRISLYLAKGAGMGNERPVRKSRGIVRDIEKMRVVRHGEADAQHSLTYYAIVDKAAPRCAWLSMKPLTGRTHQLRAHAEAIGHPIFGDPKYGRRPEDEVRRRDPLRAMPKEIEPKLHLLARHLLIPHPRGGVLDVTAPLPDHMRRTWDFFGFDARQRDPIEDAPDE